MNTNITDLDVFSFGSFNFLTQLLEVMFRDGILESKIKNEPGLMIFRSDSPNLKKELESDQGGILEEIEYGGKIFIIYASEQ